MALYILLLKPWLRTFRSCIYLLNLLTGVWIMLFCNIHVTSPDDAKRKRNWILSLCPYFTSFGYDQLFPFDLICRHWGNYSKCGLLGFFNIFGGHVHESSTSFSLSDLILWYWNPALIWNNSSTSFSFPDDLFAKLCLTLALLDENIVKRWLFIWLKDYLWHQYLTKYD